MKVEKIEEEWKIWNEEKKVLELKIVDFIIFLSHFYFLFYLFFYFKLRVRGQYDITHDCHKLLHISHIEHRTLQKVSKQ